MKNRIFIFFLLVLTLCFGFKGCGKKINPANEPLLKVYSDVKETSPRGINFDSQAGVSDELKIAADESLDVLFNDSRAQGYTNNLNFSDYTIYILPDCVPSPVTQTRSFLIRADSYDGTIYDQDARTGIGKTFAAEMVIVEPNGFITNEYVVCSAASADQEFRNAVRYGAEHIILKRNNEQEFQRTWFHGGGIGHPIIPSASPSPSSAMPTVNSETVDHFGLKK